MEIGLIINIIGISLMIVAASLPLDSLMKGIIFTMAMGIYASGFSVDNLKETKTAEMQER